MRSSILSSLEHFSSSQANAMHDGILYIALLYCFDHQWYTPFHNALWETLSPLYRVEKIHSHIRTALQNGELTVQWLVSDFGQTLFPVTVPWRHRFNHPSHPAALSSSTISNSSFSTVKAKYTFTVKYYFWRYDLFHTERFTVISFNVTLGSVWLAHWTKCSLTVRIWLKCLK